MNREEGRAGRWGRQGSASMCRQPSAASSSGPGCSSASRKRTRGRSFSSRRQGTARRRSLSSGQSEQKACAWYTTTDGARDVVELAREVAETVTVALGSSATHFSEFLQTIENPGGDARRIVGTLADAISCSGLKHLVIDDYQTIEGSGPSEAAVDLIRRIPGLQILVTTRIRPAWGNARKVVYGEVFELTREDLAMTAEESEELLGAESRSWIELAELARGWPAVLGLAALTPGAKPPDASLPSALYDFFAEETNWIRRATVARGPFNRSTPTQSPS